MGVKIESIESRGEERGREEGEKKTAYFSMFFRTNNL